MYFVFLRSVQVNTSFQEALTGAVCRINHLQCCLSLIQNDFFYHFQSLADHHKDLDLFALEEQSL